MRGNRRLVFGNIVDQRHFDPVSIEAHDHVIEIVESVVFNSYDAAAAGMTALMDKHAHLIAFIEE